MTKKVKLSDHFMKSYDKLYGLNGSVRESYILSEGPLSVFTQRFGSADPERTVLLLHGYLDHSGGLSRLIRFFLKHDWNVLTLDLPGHGFSASVSPPFTAYEQAAALVWNFWSDKNYTIQHALGHSTGAAVLFQACMQKSIDPQSLILAAPLYIPKNWPLLKVPSKAAANYPHSIKRTFRANSHNREYLAFQRRDPLQMKTLHTEWTLDLSRWIEKLEAAEKVTVPAVGLFAGKDKTIDGEASRRFYHQKLQQFDPVYLPDAGHQIFNETPGIHLAVEQILHCWLHGRNTGRHMVEYTEV
ncbi:alpha/beta hydrolase [Alkalicoccus urumqiensis]|uniref:Serine aminopeptidase S33 domain-containing protein n=1 Tax=Alkalicoccus urumqiensis TaxID=1548213 RepID=A0A2P6MDT5_ALKUR|nr:alpha/beta hydrolase [Alkalicoccus urumqiensis]PRO64437.1 hypothetical protein C6I21_14645 [Alkalicoccus urumqiensis]